MMGTVLCRAHTTDLYVSVCPHLSLGMPSQTCGHGVLSSYLQSPHV